jgi:hypothetical protein
VTTQVLPLVGSLGVLGGGSSGLPTGQILQLVGPLASTALPLVSSLGLLGSGGLPTGQILQLVGPVVSIVLPVVSGL